MPRRPSGFNLMPHYVTRDPTLPMAHYRLLNVVLTYDWKVEKGRRKGQGEGCYARIGALALQAACSERTARRVLAELVEWNLLVVTLRPGRASIYSLSEGLWDQQWYEEQACTRPAAERDP